MITVYDKKEDCCGCTACENICPTKSILMKCDEEGFFYPQIDQKRCTDCGLCKEVCAFQNGYSVSQNLVIPYVYAAKHINEKVRMNSTSGGVFSALSDYIIDKNGVVFGVSFDSDMNVIHQMAITKAEVEKFKGSKYVQSDLRKVYQEIKKLLVNGRLILFTGTPCQTAGLISYLEKINTVNLILCDIVCHGTPSPLMWREHISSMENKEKDKIIEYYFRHKVQGWHAHNEMIIYNNGKKDYDSILSQKHQELYNSHNILRPACHNCKYTNLHRPSDITIADFWGIERCLPDFDDNKGTSLVLVNTSKGQQLYEEIKRNLIYRESNTRDCLQPQLQYPTKKSEERDEFWEDYNRKGYNYIIKKYTSYKYKNRIKKVIKNFLQKIELLDAVKKFIR
ncbi:MAG: Coenzyme F420 hydrogenase/dehydrogenase, beta subunit C-terminal domain [Mobilitalea sp.]